MLATDIGMGGVLVIRLICRDHWPYRESWEVRWGIGLRDVDRDQ